MKLAEVCPYDYFRHGGVQTHIRDLSAALRAAGHEVQVIAPGPGGGQAVAGVHCFGRRAALHFDQTENDFSWALGAERARLRGHIAAQGFDLVHFHTPWDPLLSWQVLRDLRCATVATFHNTVGDGLAGRVLKTLFRAFGPRFLGRFDALTAVSRGPLEHMRPPPGRDIDILPPTIDLAPFFALRDTPGDRRPDGLPELLFVGRLDVRKGIHVLLDAYALLQREGRAPALRIVGGGAGLGAVRERVTREGWREVRVLGPVSEADKRAALARADMFCSPALQGESFGLVLMEALAAGLPVVASANPGYAALLGGRAADCLVEPGDVARLAAAIARQAADADLRRSLGDWGRGLASDYDCSVQLPAFEALFARAVERHARTRGTGRA